MKKILIILITIFISITVTIPVYATESNDYEQLSYTEKEKEFIETIENEKNFSSLDKNILLARDQNNKLMIIQYLDAQTIIYTMTDPFNQYTNEEMSKMQNQRGIISTLWGLYLLWEVYETWSGRTAKACEVVESISDFDGCGYLKQIVNDNLSQVSKSKYSIQRSYYKNPDCQPQYSAQCSTAPNAYWQTIVKQVY